MSERGTVLIVDDERDLRTLLDFNLRQAGYRAAHASTGAEALARARSLRPRVVILDLNLPDVSGMDVCRLLRADTATAELPILMLTARGTTDDRVQGLEVGADDYLAKPFELRELMLRVESVARRRQTVAEPARERLVAGGVALDLDAHLCFVRGQELPLTLQEFRLLRYLIQGRGRVRSRDDLLADAWNTSPDLETRTVDTHVKRLRDKLDPAGDIIETVRGIGYRIRVPDAGERVDDGV